MIHVWQVRDVEDGDVQVDGYVLIARAVYTGLCTVRELRKLIAESFGDTDAIVSDCAPHASMREMRTYCSPMGNSRMESRRDHHSMFVCHPTSSILCQSFLTRILFEGEDCSAGAS